MAAETPAENDQPEPVMGMFVNPLFWGVLAVYMAGALLVLTLTERATR